jgi:hypothetical protein
LHSRWCCSMTRLATAACLASSCLQRCVDIGVASNQGMQRGQKQALCVLRGWGEGVTECRCCRELCGHAPFGGGHAAFGEGRGWGPGLEGSVIGCQDERVWIRAGVGSWGSAGRGVGTTATTNNRMHLSASGQFTCSHHSQGWGRGGPWSSIVPGACSCCWQPGSCVVCVFKSVLLLGW